MNRRLVQNGSAAQAFSAHQEEKKKKTGGALASLPLKRMEPIKTILNKHGDIFCVAECSKTKTFLDHMERQDFRLCL